MREPILTNRLILRDVTEADAEQLFELDSDPEVLRYVGTRPAHDVAWYRDRTRNVHLPAQGHAWHGLRIVLDRYLGEFLGWVFIRPATSSPHAQAPAGPALMRWNLATATASRHGAAGSPPRPPRRLSTLP